MSRFWYTESGIRNAGEAVMKKKETRVISILSVLVIILAFLVSSRLWFRLDLTKNKAYTISEVSRNLYREITDRVNITYFVSDKLKVAYPLPGEIADLLNEYVSHSRGKIRFIERDPAKADLLKTVEDLGIEPRQIQVTEKNETTVATVYSGILIEYLDRKSVIPIVLSLDTLEYDLSSRIRSLVRNREKELGVIVGDSYKDWNSEYSLLNQELSFSDFKIRVIKAGDEIPPSLPALFVLGGAEDLDDYSLYLIDRYIQGGGNALFAVDGVFVNTRGSLEARAVQDKGLLAMLANYGVVVRRALVLDRSSLSLTFQTRNNNGTVISSVKYPEWIAVQAQGGNPDNPLTARFGGLDLYWASPLELSPPPGVKAEVLFSSSPQAWLQTKDFITNPNQVSQFEDELNETSGTKILGVSLSGIFPGAFEGRPIPQPPSSEGNLSTGNSILDENSFAPETPARTTQDIPVQKKSSRLVIVGDSDFAGQIMQASRAEDRNLNFLLRAAEWLSNEDDIISIRGRGETAGRLDRITDSVKRDAAMAFSRGFNTVVIPLAVIITGVFFGWKKKAKTVKEKGRS